MTAASDNIKARVLALIEQGEPLSQVHKKGYAYNDREHQDAEGWLTSAVNAVEAIISDSENAYRKKCNNLVARSQSKEGHSIGVSQDHVGAMVGVLQSLLKDVEAGLVATLADRIRGEVFDDFLDHADAYLKDKRKESGVIAGVVFEYRAAHCREA